MHGKKQFRNLFLNMVSRAATAALAIAVVFALAVILTQSAQAQTPASGAGRTEKVLYNFGNGTDGIWPYAGLIMDAAGNLYGTTSAGGTYQCGYFGCGTVFELTPTGGGGWTEQVLHNFGNGTDGAGPYAVSLIFDPAGNLYGTTVGGGTYGGGTVFELTPTAGGGGWTEQVLHSFNGTDGWGPYAGLIFDAARNLYGTTYGGGTYGNGTVFELTPAGGGSWTEQVLHSFNFNWTDGIFPSASLIFDSTGNLYGTTFRGGTSDFGTVFELTPTVDGVWTEQVLYSFHGAPDGEFPYASLIFDSAGKLYSTTWTGGPNYRGTVFELTPTGGGGWTERVLHSFNKNATDGAGPYAPLIFDSAGNLYGTTYSGPVINGVYIGTVFELQPTRGGWRETVLHSFSDGTDATNPYGGLVMDAAGNLYGTTVGGGTYGRGTVFEIVHD